MAIACKAARRAFVCSVRTENLVLDFGPVDTVPTSGNTQRQQTRTLIDFNLPLRKSVILNLSYLVFFGDNPFLNVPPKNNTSFYPMKGDPKWGYFVWTRQWRTRALKSA